MNNVNFSNTQSFSANSFTLPELLHFVKLANPQLIDYFECTECPNKSQYSIKFQLAHLFREFRVPQIIGEIIVNSKMNEDGSVEYSAISTIEHDISNLESFVVLVSPNGTEMSITCVAHVDNNIPKVVITAAKRLLKLAMKATAEYICAISKKTI